jgi:hypothetical protein
MVGFQLGIGFGVTQRLANVTVIVWMLLVALHLRTIATAPSAMEPMEQPSPVK